METRKQDAFIWINANRKIFEETAMAIHRFAETKLQEYRSTEYLAGLLEQE